MNGFRFIGTLSISVELGQAESAGNIVESALSNKFEWARAQRAAAPGNVTG